MDGIFLARRSPSQYPLGENRIDDEQLTVNDISGDSYICCVDDGSNDGAEYTPDDGWICYTKVKVVFGFLLMPVGFVDLRFEASNTRPGIVP
jgi:hypothetical protein